MAELLKEMYNQEFFGKIIPVLEQRLNGFNGKQFRDKIFSDPWKQLELKQRVRHISTTLDLFFSGTIPNRLNKVAEIASAFRQSGHRVQAFGLIFLADYIEVFGKEFPRESMIAMEEVTQLVSCEFAIRPFLIDHFDNTMKQIMRWSKHKESSVRRLASEGCRPRLPWAMGVPRLKKDPVLILEVLENLREDPSEYVRRSVANNLHDIAKDHPTLVLGVLQRWAGKNDKTDWIVRHASRTLTKKGNSIALSLQGIMSGSRGAVSVFQLKRRRVPTGGVLEFQFAFQNKEKVDTKFRIDYAIDYLTSSGKRSKKIFKITEAFFEPGKKYHFKKRQPFKDLTTRKHFCGTHTIAILVNGHVLAEEKFNLIAN